MYVLYQGAPATADRWGRPDDSDCRLSLSRKPVRYRHVWPGFLLLAALALLLVGLLRWGDHFLSPGPDGGHPPAAAALGRLAPARRVGRAARRSRRPRRRPRTPRPISPAPGRRASPEPPPRRRARGLRSGAARCPSAAPAAPTPVTPAAPRRPQAPPRSRAERRRRAGCRRARPLRRRFATPWPSAPSRSPRTPSAWRPSSTRPASPRCASASRRPPSSSRSRSSSLKDPEEGQATVERLQKDGYPPSVLLVGRTGVTVRVGPPTPLRTAVQLAEKLRGRRLRCARGHRADARGPGEPAPRQLRLAGRGGGGQPRGRPPRRPQRGHPGPLRSPGPGLRAAPSLTGKPAREYYRRMPAKKILVVDDEPEVRKLMEHFLTTEATRSGWPRTGAWVWPRSTPSRPTSCCSTCTCRRWTALETLRALAQRSPAPAGDHGHRERGRGDDLAPAAARRRRLRPQAVQPRVPRAGDQHPALRRRADSVSRGGGRGWRGSLPGTR